MKWLVHPVSTFLIFAILVAFAPACGPSAREKTISVTFAATNAARDGFETFDATHQADIVAKATDEASGKKALDDYRNKRAALMTAFSTLYRGIATAVLVNKGPADITNLLEVAAQLKAALDDLEGKKP